MPITRYGALVLRAYRPSVRLFVTLVDCDYTEQQKVGETQCRDRVLNTTLIINHIWRLEWHTNYG